MNVEDQKITLKEPPPVSTIGNFPPKHGFCGKIVDGKPCNAEFWGPWNKRRCEKHADRPRVGRL